MYTRGSQQPHTREAHKRTQIRVHPRLCVEKGVTLSRARIMYAFHPALWPDRDQRHASERALQAAPERAWRTARTFRPSILADGEAAAERHDLKWEPKRTVRHNISHDGCTLTRTATRELEPMVLPWAAGRLCPSTEGPSTTSWLVRIDNSDGNRGFCCVGVCEPTACCAWGLSLCTGMLERNARDLSGRYSGTPPPPFWPDGDGTQVLHDAYGRPANLRGRATGSVIKIILDREAGVLAFSVNGGPPLTALTGFPRGAALRPWALLGYPGDAVTISGYIETGGGPRPPAIEATPGPLLMGGSCPALSDPTCRATTYWPLTSNDYRLYE